MNRLALPRRWLSAATLAFVAMLSACVSTGADTSPQQAEPAGQLVNLRGIPVMVFAGAASYRAIYDHRVAKWMT